MDDRYAMYRQKQVLTPAIAERLVREVEATGWNEYTVPADENGMTVDQLIQDLDDQTYKNLYRSIWELMHQINRETWNFDIRGWQQPLRVAKYVPGRSHNWHVDYTVEDRSKLALSVSLGGVYTGGKLQMLEAGSIRKLRAGEGIFFPAFQGHRVTTITTGVRYVLLGWFTGPRFR